MNWQMLLLNVKEIMKIGAINVQNTNRTVVHFFFLNFQCPAFIGPWRLPLLSIFFTKETRRKKNYKRIPFVIRFKQPKIQFFTNNSTIRSLRCILRDTLFFNRYHFHAQICAPFWLVGRKKRKTRAVISAWSGMKSWLKSNNKTAPRTKFVAWMAVRATVQFGSATVFYSYYYWQRTIHQK